MHPALKGVLVEQLAADGAINLRAHGGEAVLIGILHVSLAAQQRLQNIVAEHLPIEKPRARRQAKRQNEGYEAQGDGAYGEAACAPRSRHAENQSGSFGRLTWPWCNGHGQGNSRK